MATAPWAIGIVLFSSLFGAAASLLLKKGSADFTLNPLKLIQNYRIIVGMGLYALGSVMFIAALRAGELSLLYPLVSVTYVWSCLLSMRYLDEKMNLHKWFGVFLIILGICFIGIGS